MTASTLDLSAMPKGLSVLLVPPLLSLLSSFPLPAQAASALPSGRTAAAASAPLTMVRRSKVLVELSFAMFTLVFLP